MRISLEALTSQVAGLGALDGVEPSSLTGDEAVEWIRAGGEIIQSAHAIVAALTARVSELSAGKDRTSRFARAKGFPDVGALVSEVAQVPRAEAGRMVTLGAAMACVDSGTPESLTLGAAAEDTAADAPLPLYAFLTRAVARGFSAEKAALIRTVLSKMAGATAEIERSLVERARKRPVSAVRVMCREEFERVDHEGYLRHLRSLSKDRYLKFWNTDEGMVGIHGMLDPVRAIPIQQWIDSAVVNGMRSQRDDPADQQLTAGQLAADALADLATHRMGCQTGAKSAQTTVVIHAAAKDIVNGTGAAYCHGYAGPICLEMLEQLAFGLEVAPALTGDGGLALFLGRATRFFTPAQKRAIALRDQGCARCGAAVATCDVHHIRFWSHGGPTNIDNGVLLCSGCHHRLHDYGWIIEIVDGEVWFIPPATVDRQRRRIPACSTRLAHAL